MNARSTLAGVSLLLAAAVAVALVFGPRPSPPPRTAVPAGPAGAAGSPSPAPPAPDDVRDLFAYADEPGPPSDASGDPLVEPGEAAIVTEPPVPSGPRLVGLFQRGGRVLAVLAHEGGVDLAGVGERVAGSTVVGIDGETVVVRDQDGRETTLQLP